MKRRIFSLTGGLLILCSTFITGVVTFYLERDVANYESEISDIQSQLVTAENAYQYALISDELNNIQRKIVRHGVFQSEDIQKTFDSAHAAGLYSNILSLLKASGRGNEILGEYGEQLITLRDNVITGVEPKSKLQEIAISLINESAEYRGDLGIKKAEIVSNKYKKEKYISVWRSAAIVIQLIGLVLLLIKETPLKKKCHIST